MLELLYIGTLFGFDGEHVMEFSAYRLAYAVPWWQMLLAE
jgi:hypothetical protein